MSQVNNMRANSGYYLGPSLVSSDPPSRNSLSNWGGALPSSQAPGLVDPLSLELQMCINSLNFAALGR